MKRRSRAGGEPIKTRRRKAAALKPRNGPKAVRRRGSSAKLQEQLDRRTHELHEALDQQAATDEVLRVISRSTFDLAKVLNTLLELAARLCEADKGVILSPAADARYYVAATFRHTPEFIESQNGQLFAPGRHSVVGRVLLENKSVQIQDVLADPEYALRETARLGGFQTILGVPLLRESIPIGVFLLQRAAVRSFTEKQIKLVETFADQAVIAIENVRLFDDVQKRTRELTELLQQQTATADVLKVISRSAFDLQVVLNTLVESATRLCAADKGAILMREGDVYRNRANYGYAREAVQWALANPLQPDRGNVVGRVELAGRPILIPDVLADPEYRAGGYQQAFGFRTILGVPLLRERTTIGVFALTRDEVDPFTDTQIGLVTTFADQAVIAIENVRLFEEVQARTRELTESLEQQTATSEVLRVISASPGDLQPVFEAMLSNATRICGAKFGVLFLAEGDGFRPVAFHGALAAFVEAHRRMPVVSVSSAGTTMGRVAATKQPAQVADIRAEPAYTSDPERFAILNVSGARTMLNVPMLKDNACRADCDLSPGGSTVH